MGDSSGGRSSGQRDTLQVTQAQSPSKAQAELLHSQLHALASSPRTRAPVRDYDRLYRHLHEERETVASVKQEQEQSRHELEKLQRQLEVQNAALSAASTETSALRAQLHEANLQIANLENAANTTNGMLLAARKELSTAEAETAHLRETLTTMEEKYSELHRQFTQLTHTSDENEEKAQALENLVACKERENELLRGQLEHEKKVNRMNEELVQKYKADAENTSPAALITSAPTDIQSEQLQAELVHLNQHQEELQDMIEVLKEQLEHSQREQQRLANVAEQAEQRVNELEALLDAERSTFEAKEHASHMANARGQLAKQSYDNLLQELEGLRSEKNLAIRQKVATENALTKTREELARCHEQLHEYRTKLNEQHIALQEQNKSQALALEVATLRKKIQEMHIHMAREELQEERQATLANGANPMAWAANVQKSRDLYDGVVRGLQEELDKEMRLRKELQGQVNELQNQLSEAETAAAQLDVYKAEAQSASSREQQLLLAKTTLEQQIIELSHERGKMSRELDRLHDDVVALKEQLQRAGESIDRERRRADRATMTKLDIEKEFAQLQSKHYKSEAMLDELTRRHSASEHASVAAQQDLRDLQQRVENLSEECEQLKQENEQLLRTNNEHAEELVLARELVAKYEGEIHLLESSKGSLLESLSVEREEAQIKQSRIDMLETEKAQLTRQLDDMARQHSAQLMDASALATVSIEQQLRELKLEFEQTTNRWTKVEQEKRERESDIKKLQNSLEKEKQVNMLHRAQVALLEDQIRAMRDELDVYRKLDIYSRAYTQELAHTRRIAQQRQSRTHSTPAPAGPAGPATNGYAQPIARSTFASARTMPSRASDAWDSSDSDFEIELSYAATPRVDAARREELLSAPSSAVRNADRNTASRHSTPDRPPQTGERASTSTRPSRLQFANSDVLNKSREDFQRAQRLLNKWSEK